MLTTGMPACSAFWATGVSAAPSWGRTTRASGFCAIACSTCWACESASAAWSSSNLTSLCCAAAALAFFEIAPSQPWSVGGTLAMIFTVLPVVRPLAGLPLPAAVRLHRDRLGVAAATGGDTDRQQRSAAIEMRSRLRDIPYLLLS